VEPIGFVLSLSCLESEMISIISKQANQNIIATVESTLAATTLDDLLEASLSHLLCVNNVKTAEIQLFNRGEKLITVATASSEGAKSKSKREITAQSWLLDSTVEHTGRKTQFSGLSPVFSIPLTASQGLLGFLNIQLNKLKILDRDELNNFYLFGALVGFKIKEILLTHEIGELKDHLSTVTSNNRDMQMQVTSLSKELYAISAVSTKISQSMDFDKSLRKAMATTRKFFGAALVVVFIKNNETSKPQLSAVDCQKGFDKSALIKSIEKKYIQALFSSCRPFVKALDSISRERGLAGCGLDGDSTIVGVPLKSNDNVIGAMILLHESKEQFNQEGLRLLSGMANIMAMGIDNMNLFQQIEQKKSEAEFLVRSVARFNESLDLKKTLKTVTKKGVEFSGPGSRVFLFSETHVPMIQAQYVGRQGKNRIEAKVEKEISPKQMRYIYEVMKSQKRPVLIKNLKRSKRFDRDNKKIDLLNLNIHSLVCVPLRIRKRVLGLLLLVNGKEGRAFNDHDLSFAQALGNVASLSIENARTHTASLEMSEFLEKKISEKTSQIEHIQQRQKIRMENRRDIIFRVNKSNRFIFVNKAMEVLTGFTREALFQADIRVEDVVAPVDRQSVKDCFLKVLNGDLPMVKGFEYRQLNRQGEQCLISLTIYPEKDQLGQIIGIEGVGEDITEKRRLESELKKTKELAMLGEFSSAVAHQIRNPLGNILIGAKLLQKELGVEADPGRQKDDNTVPCEPAHLNRKDLGGIFRDFTDGIQNLNQVVTELLEYTKTLKLRRSSQRLEVILWETLSKFRDQLRRNGIEVEEQFDSDLPAISVDAVLIGQAFQNIIHNAVQATPNGGRLFLFCGFYPQKAGYAFVSIHDSGPGIAQSESEKVFHPLYTTKDQGTGLGLSLAHRIVEAHNGTMWVCQNQCHHFVTKPVELMIGVPKPTCGGAKIHITLPIDDQKEDNLDHQETEYEREDTHS
jgi:PAS domain S-box-containing protein